MRAHFGYLIGIEIKHSVTMFENQRKVSFKIGSEVILSGQKLIKNTKMVDLANF